jgi:hypothetical protein
VQLGLLGICLQGMIVSLLVSRSDCTTTGVWSERSCCWRVLCLCVATSASLASVVKGTCIFLQGDILSSCRVGPVCVSLWLWCCGRLTVSEAV